MCNHVYVLNRKKVKECTCADFFDKACVTAENASLPIDKNGLCIFHSKDTVWKRENDFIGTFLKLISLVDIDESLEAYNFLEFCFVGDLLKQKNGIEYYALCITDTVFAKDVWFSGSVFLDFVEFSHVDFARGGSFADSIFKRDMSMIHVNFGRGIDFGGAKFKQRTLFEQVDFSSYAIFDKVEFVGNVSGYGVRFHNVVFRDLTDFTHTLFSSEGDQSTIGFNGVTFAGHTDFSHAKFYNHLVFDSVLFSDKAEFIDAQFETSLSSARYVGAAVEFNAIDVLEGATLSFKSTDVQNKLFKHDVQMSFKGDPAGLVEFENVNFNKFGPRSRERLTRLAKLGRVVIGNGCIKYRFQTEPRTIAIDESNAPLILELCQTFTHYFTVSNGFNLGFEVLERTEKEVQFFYYTDENISEEEFLSRLSKTEQNLWYLLSPDAQQSLHALGNSNTKVQEKGKLRAVVNAVDGVSALLMTFFRVGTRISLGLWDEADTDTLVNAIRFGNNETVQAQALHQVILAKYTEGDLGLFNQQQNVHLQFVTNSINVNGDDNVVISNSTVQEKKD